MSDLQTAADRHLLEKSQIRDTLGLLRIYHKSGPRSGGGDGGVEEAGGKRRKRGNQDTVG